MKGVNVQLKELYSQKWNGISKLLNELNSNGEGAPVSNPLLIKLQNPVEYQDADFKLMIIGQETNGWGKFYNDLDKISDEYTAVLQGNNFKHRGTFTNHFNNILSKIRLKYPSKKIGVTWNNVLKIGKAKGRGKLSNEIISDFNNATDFFKQEVSILKPDLIIFLSGPNYDGYLRQLLPEFKSVEVKGYKQREFIELETELSAKVFRTYHPNYSNRRGKEFYEGIYDYTLGAL